MVYDGDLFLLFALHATDPCSGLLVNIFDLYACTSMGIRMQTPRGGHAGKQVAVLRGHEPTREE